MECENCKQNGFLVVQHSFVQDSESRILHEEYQCEICEATGWLIQEAFGIARHTGILETGDKK